MDICGIEYAHIYSNQTFGNEHVQSILKLKEQEALLRKERSITRRIILVDDYSPGPSATFDLDQFLGALRRNQALPDVVVAESALTPYCESILSFFKQKKTQRSLVRYVASRDKYPCSLFIAAWYRLRLGLFGEPALDTLVGRAGELQTDRILTIVSDKFIEAESAALDILKETDSMTVLDKIEHRYFPSASSMKNETGRLQNPAEHHGNKPVAMVQPRLHLGPLIVRRPLVCRSDFF